MQAPKLVHLPSTNYSQCQPFNGTVVNTSPDWLKMEHEAQFPALDLVLVESGGDNLAASFSPELVDLCIYVIDVAAGDKIPRKGGPGITRSDLLVINKIDLAPLVGADLAVMERDTLRMRGDRPWCFTNLHSGEGLDSVVAFVLRQLPNVESISSS